MAKKLDDHRRGLQGPRPLLWGKFGEAGIVMVNLGAKIKNHKLRGEWAELVFMARAKEHGLELLRPWGESSPYDVVLETGKRWMRVQVKSTIYKVGHSYVCNIRPDNDNKPYTVRDIEFVAAYVIPEDVWYILPAKIVTRLKGNIWLSPQQPGHKYESYMEAWDLLKERAERERSAQPEARRAEKSRSHLHQR